MITLAHVNHLIHKPEFDPLEFDIPNSIDGTKRKAIFLNLSYFTAENQPNSNLRNSMTHLSVKFHVICYITKEIPVDDIWDDDLQIFVPQPPILEDHELVGRSFTDEFIADYKTYVNAINGDIITYPKNNSEDKEGLVNYLNQLVIDQIYTEQDILTGNTPNLVIVNQIKFFEIMFNNDDYNGMIPVKQLIQGFALNAKWKDVETKLI